MSRERRVFRNPLALVAAVSLALAACSDQAPVAPNSSGFTPPEFAVNAPFNSAGQCMEEDIDDLSDDNNTTPSCTANDIEIANATITAIDGLPHSGILKCSPGETFDLTITAHLQATSQEERQDIGAWISTDGGDARNGACNHYNLVTGSLNTVNEDEVENQDACAGMSAAGTPNPKADLELGTIDDVACDVSENEEGDPVIHIGSCLSWKVPGQDELCPTGYTGPGGTYSANDFRQATLPGTPAKCNCDGFDIPVQVVGKVTIVKNTVPDGPQNFTFTQNVDASGNFLLDDDADNTLPNSKTFDDVEDGTYTVTEGAVTGFDLTALSCNDGSSDTPSTVSLATRTATIEVDPGEHVTCTFTNTQRARIIIEKQTIPDGATGSFSFTHGVGTNSDPAVTSPFSLSDGGQQEFLNVVPTTTGYAVTEGDPTPGFDLTSIVCTDPTAGNTSTTSLATRTATVKVDPGETVTCVFTNTQRGSIVIIKDTQNPATDPQDFAYTGTGTGLSGFSLDDDGDNANTLSNTKTFSNLVPGGSRVVTETPLPSEWALTAINCTGATNSTVSTSVANRTATIGLAAGETVTCTYVNQRKARLNVDKVLVGGGALLFDFSLNPGSVSFSLADATTPFTTGFSLAPGTYRVCELNLAVSYSATATVDAVSATLINPDASNVPPEDLGNRCVDVTVAYGDDKTVVWTNTPPPGGDARTPGYWKNWASCAVSSGNQYVKAGQKGLADKTLDANLPQTIGILTLAGGDPSPDCLKAVRLLNKSDIVTAKKKANDAAFNLASPLLAALLNISADADPSCVGPFITQAQALLAGISFNGTGSYLTKNTSALYGQANFLAGKLDAYNNNVLVCT